MKNLVYLTSLSFLNSNINCLDSRSSQRLTTAYFGVGQTIAANVDVDLCYNGAQFPVQYYKSKDNYYDTHCFLAKK